MTSGPSLSPLPQRHVGAAAAGEGPGVLADSGCPPILRRQLGGADAILLGQIFPSSQIPLQQPPPTHTQTAAALVADAPAKSAQLVPPQS